MIELEADESQARAIELIRTARLGLITGGPGCHRKGQKVLRADGALVAVEDVRVGDHLAGYNGEVRRVNGLRSGFGEMARIVPVKGAPFVVNMDHVLTVVHSSNNEITDVSVRDFLEWNGKRRHQSKLFRQSFDFRNSQQIGAVSPYVLGVLLGDGCLCNGSITVSNPDAEVISALQHEAARFGLQCKPVPVSGTRCPTHRLSGILGEANPLIAAMRTLGLYHTHSDTKFIPDCYRLAPSRAERLDILAGLLDTDGHLENNSFDYISKSATLAHDVAFVARSVGLAAYVVATEKSCQTGATGWYWRVTISGHVDSVPTRIERKQAAPRQQVKNALRTGLTVEPLGTPETFYGFTLDGDGRYLLDDFTVTHNTGKTTCLKAALDQMPGVNVELAAPTGKAAKRMQEATGRDARTIHRLLDYHPVEGFRRTQTNPIDAELVIIDEASMLDVELGAALLKAIGPSTRLMLVGDANQLPPVGPGQVFADLLKCDDRIPTARLTETHRSAKQSWVNRNAPLVLAGKPIELERTHDFEFREVGPAIDVLSAVRSIALADLDAQVLIPQRPGIAGIEAANVLLQSALNPGRDIKGPALRRERYSIYVNDQVIQTSNNYQLMVFNGEIGRVLRIEGPELEVDYAGRPPVVYTFDQARSLELAYALTIHRSQGSEFKHVIAVIHSTHSYILNRALLYTCVTRTRDRVTLIGDRAGLRNALNSENKARRNSSLAERIRGELPEVSK